jgi:hypothetical protein
MGQFKPMVKMETTEPSVILKLKKGGHVAMNRGGEYGFENMRSKGMNTMPDTAYSAPAAAPKAPSMMARRAAMAAPLMKKGGKAGDMAQDKAMVKKAFKQHDMQEHEGGKGTKLKLKKGGTTKVVDGDKTDKAHGTGDVKMGKAAGYKTGGTIEGNAGKFVKTKVVDGDKKDSATGTGKVRMSNAGGFKDGGSTNWENRPADTAKPGKSNTTTGEVKEANAGGFKKGGAAKKHFATGGSVNDTGHAVAMPRKPVSKPVSNTAQSGTFKKGGKVMRKAIGGSMDDQQMPMRDMSGGMYDKAIDPSGDDMSMANTIRSAPSDAMNAVMRLLGKKRTSPAGAGRGFVNPPMARKGGGRAKC